MSCSDPDCRFCSELEETMPQSLYTHEFDKAFDDLIGNEGGYSNDKDDPGGETNWGISKRQYPRVDIKNLTREGAKSIYWTDYWLKIRAPELAYSVAFEVFDMAVNHGVPRAVMFLQEAVKVADDGEFGNITMAAYKAMPVNDVLLRLNAHRLKFYTKLSKWPKFGAGWANRVADNLLRDADNN